MRTILKNNSKAIEGQQDKLVQILFAIAFIITVAIAVIFA
jgi:hypothetical protein